jgi:protein TonB
VLEEVKVGEYPAEARRRGVSGRVKLRVGIDERGIVREVTVLAGVGHGLDEAAVAALRRFRFAPARTADGRAVACRITYAYAFEGP